MTILNVLCNQFIQQALLSGLKVLRTLIFIFFPSMLLLLNLILHPQCNSGQNPQCLIQAVLEQIKSLSEILTSETHTQTIFPACSKG